MSGADSFCSELFDFLLPVSTSRVFPHSPVTEPEEIFVFSSSDCPVREASPVGKEEFADVILCFDIMTSSIYADEADEKFGDVSKSVSHSRL